MLTLKLSFIMVRIHAVQCEKRKLNVDLLIVKAFFFFFLFLPLMWYRV